MCNVEVLVAGSRQLEVRHFCHAVSAEGGKKHSIAFVITSRRPEWRSVPRSEYKYMGGVAQKGRRKSGSTKRTISASSRGANDSSYGEIAFRWRRGPKQRAARGLARLWPRLSLPPAPVEQMA